MTNRCACSYNEFLSDTDYFVCFFSTKRSSSALNKPPRVPIPSAHSDVSNSRVRFPSRGDAYKASHDEKQRVQHEAKLERYDSSPSIVVLD